MGKKIIILDDFAPRVGNLVLELRSRYEGTKNMVGLVKKVRT